LNHPEDINLLNPEMIEVSQEDFQRFFTELRDEYSLYPVLTYWEWERQHDTFGNREEVIYEIR